MAYPLDSGDPGNDLGGIECVDFFQHAFAILKYI